MEYTLKLPKKKYKKGVDLDLRDVEDDAPVLYNDYEKRYVAFIDILGFKELIKESLRTTARKKKTVRLLVNALGRDFSAFVNGRYKLSAVGGAPDLRFYTFSDFIAISAADNSENLDALIHAAWSISEDLLSKGLLTRGGIAKGLVVHADDHKVSSRNFIFGPAFIEAYELESQVSDYPRIIFKKEVRKDYKKYHAAGQMKVASSIIVRCKDGPYGIDLFAKLQNTAESIRYLGSGDQDFRIYRRKLLEMFQANLDTPKIFKKIQWVIESFNRHVESQEGKSRYKIDLNLLL